MARRTIKRTPRRKRSRVKVPDRRGVGYGITGGIALGMILLIYALSGNSLPKQAVAVFPPGFAAFSALLLFAVAFALHRAGKEGLFGPDFPKPKKRRRRRRRRLLFL